MIPDDLVPADCPWPVVLGLDPGTRCAGYGSVVVAPDGPRLVVCGTFDAPARLSVAERLGRIQRELDEVLRALRPTAVALESAFAGTNIRSALRIGEARGMMMAAVARLGIELFEYTPSQAKRAVMGNGAASKEQVAAMVCTLLGREVDAPPDATDALAVALTHVRQVELDALTKRAPRRVGGPRP